MANATSSPSLPDGSTGTETCPSPDVTYVEAQTTSLQSVPTTTSTPKLTSTPTKTANSPNFSYESTNTCTWPSSSVTPVECATTSTPKCTCYKCNGLRKKCYLLSRKNKRLTNRIQYFKDKVQQLQNVLVWMPLITPSTRFKLTGLLVQDEFEIYIASLKTKY